MTKSGQLVTTTGRGNGSTLRCQVCDFGHDVHGSCAICGAYEVSAVSGRSPEAIKL
jgi:hypothetical protein